MYCKLIVANNRLDTLVGEWKKMKSVAKYDLSADEKFVDHRCILTGTKSILGRVPKHLTHM